MVYSCNHDTEGEVTLSMGHGKKLDHMGIQVKFFGRIDMVRYIYTFISFDIHSLFVLSLVCMKCYYLCIVTLNQKHISYI